MPILRRLPILLRLPKGLPWVPAQCAATDTRYVSERGAGYDFVMHAWQSWHHGHVMALAHSPPLLPTNQGCTEETAHRTPRPVDNACKCSSHRPAARHSCPRIHNLHSSSQHTAWDRASADCNAQRLPSDHSRRGYSSTDHICSHSPGRCTPSCGSICSTD